MIPLDRVRAMLAAPYVPCCDDRECAERQAERDVHDLAAQVIALADALRAAEARAVVAVAERDTARSAHAELAAAVRAEREARMRYALAPKGTDARAEANDAAHDACSRLVALLSAAPTPTTVPAALVREYLAAEHDVEHDFSRCKSERYDSLREKRAALDAALGRCV